MDLTHGIFSEVKDIEYDPVFALETITEIY